MFRSVFSSLLCFVVSGAFTTAWADDARPAELSSWVGKIVLMKNPGVKLKSLDARTGQTRVVGDVGLTSVKVQKVDRGFLGVSSLGQKGWISAEDVVPMDGAVAYFTERLMQNAKDNYARSQRGWAWQLQKEFDKAIADYDAALLLKPNDAATHNNRAIAWAAKKEFTKALADYGEAIRLRPGFMMAYHNRGHAYFAMKEYDKSLSDYTEAMHLKPNYADLHFDRGTAWLAKREYDQALSDFNDAIRLDPGEAVPIRNRGTVYSIKKDYTKALTDFNEAIRLNPNYAAAHADSAWLMATCPDEKLRNGEKAVAAAQRACELSSWKAPGHLSTLAAAYAEAGNFAEAVKWQTKALESAEYRQASGERATARLRLYEQGKPYRQSAAGTTERQ